jgi:hypothetical protein
MRALRRPILGFLGAFAVAIAGGCQLILGLYDYRAACPPDEDSPCLPCENASDCGPNEPCRSWVCDWGSCIPMDEPAGVTCWAGICSGEGHSRCVQCIEDGDCPGGYCFDNQCARCDNGIKDGDEEREDCGGHCLQCPGRPCNTGDECKSGFCADKRCCDSPCKDICTYCYWQTGECLYVPQFKGDIDPICAGNMTCNGGGVCALRPGEPCVSEVQCASLECVNGKCTGP